jgi:hypothetical protein
MVLRRWTYQIQWREVKPMMGMGQGGSIQRRRSWIGLDTTKTLPRYFYFGLNPKKRQGQSLALGKRCG